MRKTLLAVSLAFAFAVAAAAAQSGRRPAAPAQPQPAAEPAAPAPERASPPLTQQQPSLQTLPESVFSRELQSLDKGSFRLADFGGKVLVVNLWASWCGPCRREIPDFEEVRKDYAGRGVEFVGLTTESPRTDAERVRQFVRDVKFGFRLGWADRETAIALMNGRLTIPQTYVLDGEGRVLLHLRGYGARRGAEMLRDAIDRGLGAQSAASR
jgi:thiol-disulfide isomerase/thioredoxin